MTTDELTGKQENDSILQSVKVRSKTVNGILILGIVLGFLTVIMIVCGVAYQYFPVIETYEIKTSKIKTSQRIVLLTDLHGCMYGEKNGKLLQMIREQNPDYVCVAGDMTVKNGLHMEEVADLLKQLSEQFPVYYAPGNHEIRMPEYEVYKSMLQQNQIQYLENISISIGGNVMIYGLDLPEYWYHKCWQKRDMKREVLEELMGECRGECFSILLAHNPEYFPVYAAWGADLTLSGHVHGGIMRLPKFGGVISPSLRLFPKYDAGQYEEKEHWMVLSRGLGLHHIKLRFFNRPEISVINLSCQEAEK